MSSQLFDRKRQGWPTRCAFLITAASLMGLLAVAQKLEPDPRGFGTHTQLGLGPCAFLTVTGRLCPTCGMTTAFAWFIRGRVDRSWQANPAGCVYALLTVPFIAWLLFRAFASEPVSFSGPNKRVTGVLVGAVVLALASWLIQLMVSPGVLAEPVENLPAFVRTTGL
jgi:hypothetical protein